MQAKNISQNEMSRICGITAAYMSDIMNGKLTTGTKDTPIKDSYFGKIAQAIGYKLESPMWWNLETDNYILIINTLKDARASRVPCAIDGETGQGKSHAVNIYLQDFPSNTYKVTCDDDLTSKSFIMEMAMSVGIKPIGATYNIRKAIIQKLSKEPNAQVIIDESENAKDKTWGSMKRIMDDLKGICSVVFIGSNDFKGTMEKKADRLKTPFPQVHSRIKEGGYVKLHPFTKEDVVDVCMEHKITDHEVVKLLIANCKNMRERAGAIIKLKREMRINPTTDLQKLSKILIAA